MYTAPIRHDVLGVLYTLYFIKAMGIVHVESFPFPEPPEARAVAAALSAPAEPADAEGESASTALFGGAERLAQREHPRALAG